MEITFQAQLNEIEDIIKEIQEIDGIDSAICIEKYPVPPSIMDRNPNYQIELFEIIINIGLSIASEELFKLTKEKIKEYFKNKKIEKIQIKGKNNSKRQTKNKK